MSPDDFLESEVAVAIGATAALLSPRVRGLVRRGAVLSLSGLLRLGGVLSLVGDNLSGVAGRTASKPGGGLQDIVRRPETNEDAPPAIAADATPRRG